MIGPLKNAPQWGMFLAGFMLVGIVGFLIWRNHASFLQIKSLNISRLETASRNKSEVVSYFFSERVNDLKQLAESRQVTSYFENEALGMTKKYGLQASQMAIEEMFAGFIRDHVFTARPIYDSIVLLDKHSRPLVFSSSANGRDILDLLPRMASQKALGPSWTLDFTPGSLDAIMGCPVVVKGEVAGSVWMRIPVRAILWDLLEVEATSGVEFLGLTMGDRPVVSLAGALDERTLAELPPASAEDPHARYLGTDAPGGQAGPESIGSAGNRRLAVRIRVHGTPMDYLAIVPEDALESGAPHVMSLALSGLALLCMAGLVLINNDRTKRIVLRAQLEEKSLAEEQLLKQAYHDQLTGLPNRLFLAEHLDHALTLAARNSAQVAVFLMDLDQFKAINDTLGHPAGDFVLCKVVERFQRLIRRSDMLGRFGGDEFLLVLENVASREYLATVAEKFLAVFRENFDFRNRPLSMGVSIGIAVYPDDGQDADTLIKNADLAMYHAKESGKNTHSFFQKELKQKMVSKLSVENSLRLALAQGGLFPMYQPVVSARSRTLVGCEALVRLRKPDGQVLPPDVFIPVAEETGLIRDVDLWVLEEATTTARSWLDQGHDVLLAVNVSPKTLQREHFIPLLRGILARNGFPPANLELEITETTLMMNVAATSRRLDELRDMGVRIALDDFGTGYSSLYCLSSLPISHLKIDRSFIGGVMERNNLVKAIVDMAEGLGLTVVAEGVETQEQLAVLRQLGCGLAQGYLFSPPVSQEKFAEYLRTARRADASWTSPGGPPASPPLLKLAGRS